MKKTVYLNDFFEAFDKHDRLNQFPNTLAILFDYLEGYEAGTGEEMELDVIAICCDFTEWWIPNLADEFGTDNEQIKHALRYAYNDRTHWSGDGLGYVVLSEADFDDLKLLVDQRGEE